MRMLSMEIITCMLRMAKGECDWIGVYCGWAKEEQSYHVLNTTKGEGAVRVFFELYEP